MILNSLEANVVKWNIKGTIGNKEKTYNNIMCSGIQNAKIYKSLPKEQKYN